MGLLTPRGQTASSLAWLTWKAGCGLASPSCSVPRCPHGDVREASYRQAWQDRGHFTSFSPNRALPGSPACCSHLQLRGVGQGMSPAQLDQPGCWGLCRTRVDRPPAQ